MGSLVDLVGERECARDRQLAGTARREAWTKKDRALHPVQRSVSMSLQGLIPPLLDFRYIISAIGWALLRAGHPRRGVVRWLLELEWSETTT